MKTRSSTDPIPYWSIGRFMIKTHRETPTKVFSNHKLNHLIHFYVGVVTPIRNRLGNSHVYLVFTVSFPFKREREDLDPVSKRGRESLASRSQSPKI